MSSGALRATPAASRHDENVPKSRLSRLCRKELCCMVCATLCCMAQDACAVCQCMAQDGCASCHGTWATWRCHGCWRSWFLRVDLPIRAECHCSSPCASKAHPWNGLDVRSRVHPVDRSLRSSLIDSCGCPISLADGLPQRHEGRHDVIPRSDAFWRRYDDCGAQRTRRHRRHGCEGHGSPATRTPIQDSSIVVSSL